METYRPPFFPESENSLRMYYCGSESCTPGHAFGPAVRPHYLIHFIRQGKGIYQRSDQVYHLSRGDAFLILPGETTKYMADRQDPWSYTWIAFDGSQAEALLNCCGLLSGNPVYRSPDENARIRLLTLTDQFQQCFRDETKNVLELTGNFYLLFFLSLPLPAGTGNRSLPPAAIFPPGCFLSPGQFQLSGADTAACPPDRRKPLLPL